MITRRTTVVVGAGASKDIGFPTGEELKTKIAKLLKTSGSRIQYYIGNEDMNNCISMLSRESGTPFELLVKKSEFISQQMAMAASIDNFLDAHRSDDEIVQIGKLAIAHAIRTCETSCLLTVDPIEKNTLAKADNYFLAKFMQLFVRGHTFDDLINSAMNLSFVIFNYDRAVEHYVYHWLNNYFGRDCTEVFKSITFIHTYGSLGEFDPKFPVFRKERNDGPFLNAHLELPPIAKKIKIFTEQTDTQLVQNVRKLVNDANTLIFVGFAFEEQNLDYLSEELDARKSVFGTTFMFSEHDQRKLSEILLRRFAWNEGTLHLLNQKSQKLFTEFKLTLAEAVGAYSRE